jgi:hypothetical protein
VGPVAADPTVLLKPLLCQWLLFLFSLVLCMRSVALTRGVGAIRHEKLESKQAQRVQISANRANRSKVFPRAVPLI